MDDAEKTALRRAASFIHQSVCAGDLAMAESVLQELLDRKRREAQKLLASDGTKPPPAAKKLPPANLAWKSRAKGALVMSVKSRSSKVETKRVPTAKPVPGPEAEERILRAIIGGASSRPEIVAESGLSPTAWQRAKARLLKAGQITQVGAIADARYYLVGEAPPEEAREEADEEDEDEPSSEEPKAQEEAAEGDDDADDDEEPISYAPYAPGEVTFTSKRNALRPSPGEMTMRLERANGELVAEAESLEDAGRLMKFHPRAKRVVRIADGAVMSKR